MMTPNLDNRVLVTILGYLKEKNDEELAEELFRMIAEESYFLSPVSFSKKPIIQRDGSLRLENDTKLRFPTVRNEEGKAYYPAFTERSELQKWDIDFNIHTVLTLCIDDYVDMLTLDNENAGIVLNPFNQSFIIDKDFLIHLLQVRKENKPEDVRKTILDGLKHV
jgi:hypothetical protein